MPKRNVKRVGAHGRTSAYRPRTSAARVAALRQKRAKYTAVVNKRVYKRKTKKVTKKGKGRSSIVKQAKKARSSTGNGRTDEYPMGRQKKGVETRLLYNVSNFPICPAQMYEFLAGNFVRHNMSVQPLVGVDHLVLGGTANSGLMYKPAIRITNTYPTIGDFDLASINEVQAPEELEPHIPFFTTAEVTSSDVEITFEQNMWPQTEKKYTSPFDGRVETIFMNQNPAQAKGFWVFAYTPTFEDVTKTVQQQNSSALVSNMFYDAAKYWLGRLFDNVDKSANTLVSAANPVSQNGKEGNFGYNNEGFRCDWAACGVPGLKLKYVSSAKSTDKIFKVNFKHGMKDFRKWFGLPKTEWKRIREMGSDAASQRSPLFNSFGDGATQDNPINVNPPSFDWPSAGVPQVPALVRPMTYYGVLPDTAWIGGLGTLAEDFNFYSDTFIRLSAEIKITVTKKLTLRGPKVFGR